jgi:transposase
MSEDTSILSDDPTVLKAIIASLEAENAKLSATLRAHDLLVQTLRTRIAKLQKQAFGKSSEKIGREIEQLELALEDLQVAMAEADEIVGPDGDGGGKTSPSQTRWKRKRKPRAVARVSQRMRHANAGNWIRVTAVRIAAAICASLARMSAR